MFYTNKLLTKKIESRTEKLATLQLAILECIHEEDWVSLGKLAKAMQPKKKKKEND